ncbi:MAG: hypothetical protein U1E65_04100 [Myxococcota bacterium]
MRVWVYALLLLSACVAPPPPPPPSGPGWTTIRQGYSSFHATAARSDNGTTETLTVSQVSRVVGFIPARPNPPKPTLQKGQVPTPQSLDAR